MGEIRSHTDNKLAGQRVNLSDDAALLRTSGVRNQQGSYSEVLRDLQGFTQQYWGLNHCLQVPTPVLSSWATALILCIFFNGSHHNS